jgi:hypothetical protein
MREAPWKLHRVARRKQDRAIREFDLDRSLDDKEKLLSVVLGAHIINKRVRGKEQETFDPIAASPLG